MSRSLVSIVEVRDSIQTAVRAAMDRIGWKDILEKGKPTALKVNLGWDLFIPGSITSPWVVEGVIMTIRDWVGPISLVEADQVLESIESAYQKSGMPELVRRYGISWVNMSHMPTISVPVEGGVAFTRLELPKILVESQVITIPVMKTHAKTTITGSLKNQWGCISKLRHNYHLVLSDALADINATVKPVLSVMDATVGLEGNGPKTGKPRIVNRVIASSDLVALDSVQASLMGFDPSRIGHLNSCAARGIGSNDLQSISIDRDDRSSGPIAPFQPADHNLISLVEEGLRRSRLKWLVFDTPLFSVMLFGAKVWYLVWYYLVSGQKHWRTILAHPFYGPLWKNVLERKTL